MAKSILKKILNVKNTEKSDFKKSLNQKLATKKSL